MPSFPRWLVVLALALSATASRAHAKPRPPATAPLEPAHTEVPPQLAPWIDWVLDDVGDARCTQVGERRVCVWPSALSLDVVGNSASFSLRVYSERDGPGALPGSRDHWPIGVQVDGVEVAVREPSGVPTVDVSRGAHTINGRFLFADAPSSLALPASVGALTLRRDGNLVPSPRREEDGMLWIRESARGDEREQRLTLTVHRRIEDALPLRVLTRIIIHAAGKPREIVFDDVLVAGARPLELRAELPAQLSPQGRLRLQVQGGTYRIEVRSIVDGSPERLVAPKLPAPWPDQEVWVFEANDPLRHVELSGPPQVDAARTDLDADWRGLSTFLVSAGQPLRLETRRRGEAEPPPNALALERQLWLDLDGEGYTVRDQLRGELRRGFRLDLTKGKLGRAVVNGEDVLVTRRGGQSGVELRASQLDLATEWRLEHARSELPAVGYSEPVDSLSATLHLPPGYRLLAAQGPDFAHGTWFDRWDLFDFFFVLLIALAVGKLSGWAWGALALITLVLCQQEPGAPDAHWLILLAFVALLRALRDHSPRAAFWARLLFAGALLVMLLDLVPFATLQVRSALYPQLASVDGMDFTSGFGSPAAPEPAPTADRSVERAAEQAAAELLSAAKLSKADLAGGSVRGEPAPPRGYAQRELIDPEAIVQTGPGLPNWSFAQFTLGWSGPVTSGERIRLWLVPPLGSRLWSLGSALLPALLLYGVLSALRRPRPRASDPPTARGADVVVTVLSVLLCALACAPRAHAQAFEPSPAMLKELRQRLLEPPRCAPDCLAVPSLSLSLGEHRLEVQVEIHAGASASYRVPGPLAQWAVDRVQLDGHDALAVARLDDGFLHVRVPAGIHRLELSGPIPTQRAWTLALGGPAPHRVETHGRGWVIDGLHADGSAEPSLELRREVPSQSVDGELALVQWVEVTRELELGLRFQVRTTLERLGPAHDGLLLRLKLWPGESVNEAGLQAENGSVIVSMPRDQRSLSFVSTIDAREALTLTAATPVVDGELRNPYSEQWVIRPGPLYRVSMEGVPPLAQRDEQGRYAPRYRPYPGETLRVHAERLAADEGRSVTIDRAELSLRPGNRSEETTLTLALRTSRGSTETITLPRGLELAKLSVDGVARTPRLRGRELEVPLDPGSHAVQLTMQRQSELGFRWQPPVPKVGRALSNVHVLVALPPDRWLLATQGPAWGPAVLWWGYLALLLIAAFALGRVPGTPLYGYQWALLGLGLTQVPTECALVVVAWLFALAWRERERIARRRLFYLVQALLVVFTLVALGCLAYAVQQGLLVSPDMQVQGMLSNQNILQWYTDRTPGRLPDITLWTAPVWIYKGLMLIWALWLAQSLLQWLRWGWASFRKGGTGSSKAPGGPLYIRRPRTGPRAGPHQPSRGGGSNDSERAGVS